MAKGIRFTKAERELIVMMLTTGRGFDFTKKEQKTVDNVLEKLELAEMPVKKANGLTVNDAIAAFREVLGQRLVTPPFSAVGVLAQMKNRIQALGLTRGDCVTVAKRAGESWAGVIKAESLVRQADTLLAQAARRDSQFAPPPRSSTPVELGEEDI